jgi:hypothetical protein
MTQEQVERLLNLLDPRERAVVDLRVEGLSIEARSSTFVVVLHSVARPAQQHSSAR